MKPLKKGGGLVDFKESLIFEREKDKSHRGAENFKKEMQKKYDIKPSYKLYREIINYQINKYGSSLEGSETIEYDKWFAYKHPKMRKYHNDLLNKNRQQAAYLERIEKKTKKNKIYSIEKDNILKCYIVWEIHKNYKVDVFRSNKKECEKWVKKNG